MNLAGAYTWVKQVLIRDEIARGEQPAITGAGVVWNATEGERLEVRVPNSKFANNIYHAILRYTGIAPHLLHLSTGAMAQAHYQIMSGDAIGHPRCACYGTLGAFLVAPGRQTLALSNSHVLGLSGRARAGDPIFDQARNHIGNLFKTTRLLTNRMNLADAALVALNDTVQPTFASQFGTQPAALGDQVYKDGASTGRTNGISISTAYTLAVNINEQSVWFEDQLAITANPLEKFSSEGDSGSLVRWAWGNQPAIGLLFAGDNNPQDLMWRSYANPIDAVFQELSR